MSQGAEGESCSRKRMKTSNSKQDETRVMMTRPSMPDLVIDRILPLLPTKAALRMSFLSKQWEGLWSLSPVLDFDESDNIHDEITSSDKLEERHTNFIEIVQRYLEFREKNKTTQGFERFRLRMTRYLHQDYPIVNNWLKFAFERSVKEVDLSFEINLSKLTNHFYWLSYIPANSLTTLNLEFVRIPFDFDGRPIGTKGLPSLKNMSLKNVYFEMDALNCLIYECPSIESLSLTSCVFDGQDMAIRFGSSSLRYFEVTKCRARDLEVEGENLEYFKLLSNLECFNKVTIKKSFNLKYIGIDSQYLETLVIHGWPQSVEAAIHAPRLETSRIVLEDSYKEGESHNFQALRDFLKAFDGTLNSLDIYIHDFKVIIFPEKFRETVLSPLPRLKQLKVFFMSNPPTAKDISNLNDSLTWMVPSKRFDWSCGAPTDSKKVFHCPYWLM